LAEGRVFTVERERRGREEVGGSDRRACDGRGTGKVWNRSGRGNGMRMRLGLGREGRRVCEERMGRILT